MHKTAAPLALILLLAPFGGADGKDREPPGGGASRIADDMIACRTVADSGERLACYDRNAAAFATARDTRQLVVVDREKVRETRRSLFGLTLPRINLFGNGKDDDADEEEIREVNSTVRSVSVGQFGLYGVTLADGSVWRFTDQMTFAPRPGDPIKIERAALGSFKGSVKGRVAVKIRRDR